MNNTVVIWHSSMTTSDAVLRLGELVPLLANPMTHRPVEEAAVRISDVGWDHCDQCVIEFLHCPDPLVVQFVLRAIAYATDHLAVQHGDNIVNEMVQLLDHNSPSIQSEAIVAVRSTHYGNENVIGRLRQLLIVGPDSVRVEAITKLVEIDPFHRFASEAAEFAKNARQL